MTGTSILPTIGQPPPGFKRPFVPDHLRSDSLQQDRVQPDAVRISRIEDSDRSENRPLLQQKDSEQPTSRPVNLSAGSAVALQVRESVAEQAANPRETSLASQQEERASLTELTDEEKAEVERLKERDREVRAHETAHVNAGRGYTGTPSYEYARGPDGVQYAVGGHVQIDVSEVPDDPRATIAKMEVVRQAALAPAQPSGQDRAVAAAAAAKMREAQAELAEDKAEKARELLEKQSSGNQDAANVAFGTGGAQPGATAFSEKLQEISLNLLV